MSLSVCVRLCLFVCLEGSTLHGSHSQSCGGMRGSEPGPIDLRVIAELSASWRSLSWLGDTAERMFMTATQGALQRPAFLERPNQSGFVQPGGVSEECAKEQ